MNKNPLGTIKIISACAAGELVIAHIGNVPRLCFVAASKLKEGQFFYISLGSIEGEPPPPTYYPASEHHAVFSFDRDYEIVPDYTSAYVPVGVAISHHRFIRVGPPGFFLQALSGDRRNSLFYDFTTGRLIDEPQGHVAAFEKWSIRLSSAQTYLPPTTLLSF